MKGRHLLIDGYNVLFRGRHPRNGRKIDQLRQEFVSEVASTFPFLAERVSLVFDGSGDLRIEHPLEDAAFSVVFAPAGLSADGMIEQWVQRSEDPATCVVVTADRQILEGVVATGAEVWSPETFETQLGSARSSLERHLTA